MFLQTQHYSRVLKSYCNFIYAQYSGGLVTAYIHCLEHQLIFKHLNPSMIMIYKISHITHFVILYYSNWREHCIIIPLLLASEQWVTWLRQATQQLSWIAVWISWKQLHTINIITIRKVLLLYTSEWNTTYMHVKQQISYKLIQHFLTSHKPTVQNVRGHKRK